jgi:hypothetical protein
LNGPGTRLARPSRVAVRRSDLECVTSRAPGFNAFTLAPAVDPAGAVVKAIGRDGAAMPGSEPFTGIYGSRR